MPLTDREIHELIGALHGGSEVAPHSSEEEVLARARAEQIRLANLGPQETEYLRMLGEAFGFVADEIPEERLKAFPWFQRALELAAESRTTT